MASRGNVSSPSNAVVRVAGGRPQESVFRTGSLTLVEDPMQKEWQIVTFCVVLYVRAGRRSMVGWHALAPVASQYYLASNRSC